MTLSPNVTTITATPSSGTLGIGSQIVLTLTTDRAVHVDTTGGTPSLTLSNGASAAYTGVDGSGHLQFTYTVADGNTASSNLAVTGYASNGGGITGGGLSFATRTDLTVGNNSVSVALKDVNGDGKIDIVTANFNTNNVSVLLGNGDGTFQAKTDFATGTQPFSVSLADINGDGKTDIVTSNFGSNNASVLLGNGDGTFQTKTDFTAGSRPVEVTLVDVNGDNKLDIVTANRNANTASVLLGNGDGTFHAKTDVATGGEPHSVVLADVNGDNKLDLITANSSTTSNTASVLLGNGDGTFQAKTDFATGGSPYGVAVADLNGDGKLDIVTANYGTSNASVLLGNGDGTFQAKTDFATGRRSVSVKLLDVNGDSKLDIVTADYYGGTTSVLLGNGDGTFQAKTSFATASYPYTVALADLNGDGKPDIVTSQDGTGGPVSVLLNTSTSAGVLSASSVASATGSSTGLVIDAAAPTHVSSEANGTSLVMTYSEALDAAHGPVANAFTVNVGGSVTTVTGVAVDGSAKTITLTLASAVTHGQAVTVAYSDPTSGNDANAIQDAAGNDAASLSATNVTNTTPAPYQPPVTPPITPTVTPTVTIAPGPDGERLIHGTSGNDTLQGTSSATDVVRIDADSHDVTVTHQADGTVTISGFSIGTDKLVDIDILRFNDRVEIVDPPKAPISTGFSEENYLASNPDVAAAVQRGDFASGKAHYDSFGQAEGRATDVAFDETFYLAHNKDVAEAVQRGELKSGLEHFLRYGDHEGRDPNVLFSQKFYLAHNDDVANAVKAGTVTSAYDHFQGFGWKEARDPSAFMDTKAYLAANKDVAATGVNPLDHFLDHGVHEGRAIQAVDNGYWLS